MKGMMTKAAIVVFIAVIGAAPSVFAHGGYGGHGWGGHMMEDYGYGGGPMMGPGYGGHMMGWRGDWDDLGLSREQATQLEEARESFFDETRGLRDNIYEKSAQIRREFSQRNPDRSRIVELQKELSQLESQFDQKRLDYELEVRKIAPEIQSRYGRGYGPGAGWCRR
ncbi:MAG: periplasmic heavy metal sensor [Desulfobacteraceae bacterium]|nr:periplasmic heavy metal sensor [Desulfobacteraceae bacterium]